MEGAVCSSAAAEQITGQPAELGSSPPSPAADVGLPAWSLAALGELGAGWGTPQGCSSADDGWDMPLLLPHCASSAVRSASGSFLLPDPGECQAALLPAPQLGKGEQGGCRWVSPSKSLPAFIRASLPGPPLTALQLPAAPTCVCLARSPPKHPASAWMGPAGSYVQQQLNTNAEAAAGKCPRDHAKGLSQDHADLAPLCRCGTSPRIAGGTPRCAPATTTRPCT